MINKEMIDSIKDRRYIIVDDDKNLCNIISQTFEKIGIEHYVVTEPRDAIKLIDTMYIDAIITDLNMPDMNGFQMSDEIIKKYNKPVIMISGIFDKDVIKIAEEKGVYTFLHKPLNFIELFDSLCNIDYENFKTTVKN
jgi:DNA-binding NtrC family response regulator